MATRAKRPTSRSKPAPNPEPKPAPKVEPLPEPVDADAGWPLVTIGILTYKRLDTLKQTINALREKLIYPPSRIQWVIADDASGPDYRAVVDRFMSGEGIVYDFISTPKQSGWGANANHLRQFVTTPYLYFTEDDYVPTAEIPLFAAVALMEVKREIGMVRFRGTAGSHLVYHGLEADIREWFPEFGQGLGVPGKINYLQIDGGSPDLYIYSNGPHLVRLPDFPAFYGEYPVGAKLGETEEKYAHTVRDAMRERWNEGAPAIVILPEFVAMHFDHIGKSYQHTAEDR